jgi:hypothetical protein
MGLTLGILEGQNFTRKNHHGVGPRRAGAAELAAADALDRCEMAAHSSPLEIVLARNGCRRRGCFDHSAQRRGPERTGLTLDILEGQNFAGKSPRRRTTSRRCSGPAASESITPFRGTHDKSAPRPPGPRRRATDCQNKVNPIPAGFGRPPGEAVSYPRPFQGISVQFPPRFGTAISRRGRRGPHGISP